MFTVLRPSIVALTIPLLTAVPGSAQTPVPDAFGHQAYPVQCSLPLRMSVRSFLLQLRLELKPNDEQRPAFDLFDAAVNKAVDSVTDLCRVADQPGPTDRLQTALTRITESLRAIAALQPAAQTFYAALSDEQKSRLGDFDRWFNRASSLLSEWALNAKSPSRSDERLGGDRPMLNDGAQENRWRDQENLGRLWRE